MEMRVVAIESPRDWMEMRDVVDKTSLDEDRFLKEAVQEGRKTADSNEEGTSYI